MKAPADRLTCLTAGAILTRAAPARGVLVGVAVRVSVGVDVVVVLAVAVGVRVGVGVSVDVPVGVVVRVCVGVGVVVGLVVAVGVLVGVGVTVREAVGVRVGVAVVVGVGVDVAGISEPFRINAPKFCELELVLLPRHTSQSSRLPPSSSSLRPTLKRMALPSNSVPIFRTPAGRRSSTAQPPLPGRATAEAPVSAPKSFTVPSVTTVNWWSSALPQLKPSPRPSKPISTPSSSQIFVLSRLSTSSDTRAAKIRSLPCQAQ